MKDVTIIGLDLANTEFQIHGVDDKGQAILRKRIRRGQVLKLFSTLFVA